MAPATTPARSRLVSALAVTAIVTLVGLGAGPAISASATWSTPVATTPDQGDTVGTVTAPDGTITTVVDSDTRGIRAVSSFDGGATWQPPVNLSTLDLSNPLNRALRATIGVTSTGLLAIAWVESTPDVSDPDVTIRSIQIVISSDGGRTWTAPIPLPTVSIDVDDPAIGSSSAQGFTVVWREDFFDKRASSTTNGGTTWSPSVFITQARNSYESASLASVGANDIVVVFQEFLFDVGHTIQSRRSTDGGVTWAVAVTVAPDNPDSSFGNSRFSRVVSPSPGKLVAFWDDPELFAATSTDNGVTWGAAIKVSGSTEAREFALSAVDASTVAVVWYPTDGNGGAAYYAEVELGALSSSAPVPINPASVAFFRNAPTLTAFGTSRVVTWFAEGASSAGNALLSAVSCDGGATWRATTTIASGKDVSSRTVVALSGTVVTAFWSDYDALADDSVPFASAIDDPCSVPELAADEPELAATGAEEGSLVAILAALGLIIAGLAFIGVQRATARR